MRAQPFKHDFRTPEGVDIRGALGYGKALIEIINHVKDVTADGKIKRISALVLLNRILATNEELTILLREAERELQAEKEAIESQFKNKTT